MIMYRWVDVLVGLLVVHHRGHVVVGARDPGDLNNIRPVHLLRVFLLRVLESNFPGDPLQYYTDMTIIPGS